MRLRRVSDCALVLWVQVQMCWPLDTGLLGRVAISRKAELVPRPREHPAYRAEVDLRTSSSVLTVPILGDGGRGTAIGMLQLSGKATDAAAAAGGEGGGGDPAALGAEDLPAIVAFANGIAPSLENAMQVSARG